MNLHTHAAPDAAPAPLFDPEASLLIDDLDGETPTWRMHEEPIYLEVVRDLGKPGTLLGPPLGDVVAGEVLDPDDVEEDEPDVEEEHPRAIDAPPTVPIPLRPTTAIPVTGRGGKKRRQPTARRAAS